MSEADAHIQDNDILKMSRQETNDAGNRIRFVATLPSGRDLHSEWLDPGKRREAVQAWLGAVRAEIVADEEEARLQARKAALMARAQQDTAREPQPTAPSVAIPASTSNQTAERLSTPVARGLSSAPSAPSLSTDPNVFVRQAVAEADKRVAYWRAEAAKAIAETQAAEADLKKWRAIAQSLGVPTDEASGADRAAAVEPGAECVPAQQSGDPGSADPVSYSSAMREV